MNGITIDISKEFHNTYKKVFNKDGSVQCVGREICGDMIFLSVIMDFAIRNLSENYNGIFMIFFEARSRFGNIYNCMMNPEEIHRLKKDIKEKIGVDQSVMLVVQNRDESPIYTGNLSDLCFIKNRILDPNDTVIMYVYLQKPPITLTPADKENRQSKYIINMSSYINHLDKIYQEQHSMDNQNIEKRCLDCDHCNESEKKCYPESIDCCTVYDLDDVDIYEYNTERCDFYKEKEEVSRE